MNATDVIAQEFADQATGCRATPGGPYTLYDNDGNAVSDERAREILLDGGIIGDPNAGSRSYRDICTRLELGSPAVLDWTSSAGDWCFRVDGAILFQTNRYPYHGFNYTLGEDVYAEEFEDDGE